MKTLITLVLLLVSTSLFAQNNIITSDKQKQIVEYINHFETNKQLMGNVSIFEDGKEIINKTFGDKNNTDTTKYTIGSITKMFTAVLFAQLSEKKKIDLNEKLSNYFPQIPNAKEISIKQMLNHTSGLQDYVVKQDTLYTWLFEPVKHEDIMTEIIRQGSAFAAGDTVSYSNGAYYLLARILEQKYQKKYKEIIAKNIIKPLHLKNTISIDEENNYLNSARSYQKKNGEWQEIADFYFPNVSGVGGIISNTHDLNVFVQALFSEKLIKLSTLKNMLPVDKDWFGMGVMKVPFYEHIAYGHGGDTFGTHSVMSYNSKNKLAISYIINGENYPTNNFAVGLLSIIYDKKFNLPEFKEYIPEKNLLELYQGTYGAEVFPIKIKIYLEENELKAKGEGQPSFTLTAIEKNIFEFAQAGLQIEFKPYENKLILKQGGQVFELKK
ncbi:serine hydrolase domain-containing protein [Bernardetia sp. MNP-M8]|uniref:serine hydrolase domain-containing protein n=1 Tax=Bernardetia sp. MNP-M8 TaxID=3127470 RepID=UPI0030CBF380